MTQQQDIITEIERRRWKWLGHVLRKEKNYICRISLRWSPAGKRKRGRPRETWRRTIETEMALMGKTWGEIEKIAKDRKRWRDLVSALCAAQHKEAK